MGVDCHGFFEVEAVTTEQYQNGKRDGGAATLVDRLRRNDKKKKGDEVKTG